MIRRAACFVPGFPGLWTQSDWRQLAIAVSFASTLNFAVVATYVWPEWFSVRVIYGAWAMILLGFLGAVVYNFSRWERWFESDSSQETEARFFAAQEAYLKGEYFEAEALLHRILATRQQDIEAALLLVSVHSRTQRWRSALRMLDRIELLDDSVAWTFEMLRERAKIQNQLESQMAQPSQAE